MGERKPLILRYMAVDELVPYARNARKHPPAQIAMLAGIIRQFGFRSPVLVDGARSIIAAHPRLPRAKQAGLTEVPTIDRSDL
jgi:ParB-like chromosome segregation protein Spo0J